LGYFSKLWTLCVLLSFSVTAYDWVWISGSDSTNQVGVYGTIGISSFNNVPVARSGAVSWIDNQDNLWLFGGRNDDVLNDLWKFDGTYWTWISGSSSTGQPGVYGTKGVPSSNNVPGARGGYGVSWIDSHDNFWLFGGSVSQSLAQRIKQNWISCYPIMRRMTMLGICN
jgi:hypothetical protein